MAFSLLKSLRTRARGFAGDDRGSVNIEAILFFPLLVSVIAATMVLYDGFRRDSLNQKAAYAIGDLLSRETSEINGAYLDGARDLVSSMIGVDQNDVTVRVTQVSYSAGNNSYVRNWSYVSGNLAGALTSSQVRNMADDLPGMSNGERIILVDTFVDHNWAIDLGLDDTAFQASIVTRPRFAPQLAWSGN
ncbi:TadE/TadG family type IV pilus assembly protein [Roseobacteraceae bacterium S113]